MAHKQVCLVLCIVLLLVVCGKQPQKVLQPHANDLVVYDGKTGKLAAGWLNFSWAKVNLTSTTTAPPGDQYSISMVCTGWQGLYLSQPTAWDVSDYNTFSFWLDGGSAGNSIVITVQIIAATNSKSLAVSDYIQPNHQIPTNKWVQVQIPLSNFGLVSSEIKGFWFQANGPDAPTAYFDDIAFEFAEIPPVNGPALAVDGSKSIPINKEIFGVTNFWNSNNNTAFVEFIKELKIPLNRIGGDGVTRYNWQVDASNAGEDWYYMSGSGVATPVPGAMYDNIIMEDRALGVKTVVTIPMIEYITKSSEQTCSFPKSVYPNQQSYNPYVHPKGDDCGNGKNSTGGNILDKNIGATDIPNTPAIQKGFVQHIVSKWGASSTTGILYQLDNEVSNWAFMHRDVHPYAVTYPEIVNQTIIYAAAVKSADASATVAAPSEIQFAWFPDWGGLKNVQYFLQQMQAYEKSTGKRILDTYDAHYPDTNNHWPVLTDVAKLKQTVDATYPGTGISFSEWTMAGTGPLGGALALADQLGQYAANQVVWASIWGFSVADLKGPISYGLRIYLNYDGKGATFGDKYVSGSSAQDSTLSVHAALRSSDGALTILVINKIAAAQKSSLSLSNYAPGNTAHVYQYSIAKQNAIVQVPNLSVSSTGFTTVYEPFSLTMVVLTK